MQIIKSDSKITASKGELSASKDMVGKRVICRYKPKNKTEIWFKERSLSLSLEDLI